MIWNPGSRYTVSALRPATRDTSEESPTWIARLAHDTATAPVIASLRASLPAATDSVSRALPPR